MKRKVLLGVLIGLLIFSAGTSFAACKNTMALFTAYKAKRLCSDVFISMRDPEIIQSQDLAAVRAFPAIIDYAGKAVTVTFQGKIRKRAIYREGCGCTLVNYATEEEVLNQARVYVEPRPRHPQNVPWPTGDLTPKAELPAGVDKVKLAEAMDKAFSEPDPKKPRRTRAVVVVYKGRIIAERYASGFSQSTPLLGWSMTKSVTNALIGILVGQGRLLIQEPASVPEWSGADDPRRSITLDQLLRMSSGLKFIEEYTKNSDATCMLFGTHDTAAYAASQPLETEPDSKWSYSSGTANILSRIVRGAVGGTSADYFAFPRQALFNRIGMRSAIMEPDASGTFVGSSFMYATARDWARFGLLYLQDGVWEGTRILPEGWVDYSRRPTPKAPQGRYGAQFWLNAGNPSDETKRPMPLLPTDLFFASGFEGQSVTIIPSKKLVAVRLGLSQAKGAWNLEEFLADVLKAIP
ncbi:MAG: serine hydrolase [Deltaproteobacteria bacterium]|nr:serine hydrolase [Deltaproteobacteria bacterium]MBW2085028.1 serine hydrolase [Deltaproteobacteria bacterium]